MIRRLWPLLAGLLACGLLLGTVAPAAAYNTEGTFHLRLTRLDPVRCDTAIRIRAKLTDNKGEPVLGTPVTFTFKKSKPGDNVSPSTVVTNSHGRAITVVTLVCINGNRVIQVTGPKKARAQMTLELKKREACEQDGDRNLNRVRGDRDCDDDNGDHDANIAAAAIVPTVGSSGGGLGSIATAGSTGAVLASSSVPSPAMYFMLPTLMSIFVLVLVRGYRRRGWREFGRHS